MFPYLLLGGAVLLALMAVAFRDDPKERATFAVGALLAVGGAFTPLFYSFIYLFGAYLIVRAMFSSAGGAARLAFLAVGAIFLFPILMLLGIAVLFGIAA